MRPQGGHTYPVRALREGKRRYNGHRTTSKLGGVKDKHTSRTYNASGAGVDESADQRTPNEYVNKGTTRPSPA
jgi:hypothetical protein